MRREAIGGLLAFAILVAGDAVGRPITQRAKLDSLSREYARLLSERRPQVYHDLLASKALPQMRLNRNRDIRLMFIDESGRPVYYTIENLNAAKTISTDDVWPGGSGGYSLDGSGTASGKLGIWDAGGVRLTHQEFGGRVAQMDSPGSTNYHATHVAGTMVASGIQSSAKGMSPAASLAAYDWDNDESEMAAAASAGMNVSNHSYGFITGWYYSDPDWYWYGDIAVSTTEDYWFGFYTSYDRQRDEIAYLAPYYTIVKSAGNDRSDDGPGPGGGHYVWQDGQWTWSTDTRDPDGGTDGYDCLPPPGLAKNIITVGAVADIPGGYTGPGDVVMSSFSSWGPTDDGRIKPDLVANGISLYSSDDDHDSDYLSLSGTSMSTPNVSGSVNLLIRHYEATHGSATPLSSTVKAILVQTADESGPSPGPDYMFGWGLMNTLKAADLIKQDSVGPPRIIEDTLGNGETDIYTVVSDGSEPLRITLAWTDPPGTPPSPSLDPSTPMLVNDLDIRLQHVYTGVTYLPYVLDRNNPAQAATTGDNVVDNVEQVHISLPLGSYTVTISHKGSLASAQAYSLILSTGFVTCVDSDGDGYGDPGQPGNQCPDDNCPTVYNPGQEDFDQDGIGDSCDTCPNDPDNDIDGDGICGDIDNCPGIANSQQEDLDVDGVGDSCDNCPDIFNPGQEDTDADGIGNSCDNCPTVANPSQVDDDSDGVGNVCDNCPDDPNTDQADGDGDGVGDVCDNCPTASNSNQADVDADGVGDVCDNCPDTANADQADTDGDGIGDACCCVNRGNADGIVGPAGPIDVADLTYLVDYLFGTPSGPSPPCPEQGNVDAVMGPAGLIDIADLTYLVAYLFQNGPAPPPCP
ncbi:MAG: S8 family serine peptidase [Candidatus Zixiibacteriota bacterium]